MGYSLSAHAAGLITNEDVGGGCSYDKVRGAWLVSFPDTPLGLRTAAKLYCGVIKEGYTISSIDALRIAILDYFEVSHFEDLPDEIMDGAII